MLPPICKRGFRKHDTTRHNTTQRNATQRDTYSPVPLQRPNLRHLHRRRLDLDLANLLGNCVGRADGLALDIRLVEVLSGTFLPSTAPSAGLLLLDDLLPFGIPIDVSGVAVVVANQEFRFAAAAIVLSPEQASLE